MLIADISLTKGIIRVLGTVCLARRLIQYLCCIALQNTVYIECYDIKESREFTVDKEKWINLLFVTSIVLLWCHHTTLFTTVFLIIL